MAKFARSAPTQQELIDGGNHLLYEVLMLNNTVALLRDHARWSHGWEEFTLYMATVESFLVHARSLIDFLCTAPSEVKPFEARDIFAFDFCTAWTPKPWSGDEWKAISEQIIHLSYNRPEVGRNWEHDDLLYRLDDGIERFLKQADHLHPHFHKQFRHTLDGGRMAVAYTPAVASGAPIASALNVGFAQTAGTVASTSLIDPSLLVDAPSASD